MHLGHKRYWAEIDLDAVQQNFKYLRKKLKTDTKICCVIKADAYGHGAVRLAKLYESLKADWLAVSNIEEAIQLREAEIKLPVLVMGYTPPECAEILADNNISQAVFSIEYAEMLSKFATKSGKKVKIHIKLDSGMGRVGFPCINKQNDIVNLNHAYVACCQPNLETEGVFSHFAVSDEDDADSVDYTKKQYENFMYGVKFLENMGVLFKIKHISNSAAILRHPEFSLDMVRAGIALYGAVTSENSEELVPVMSLKTVVSQVKTINAGESVGYGRTFIAEKVTKIATLPLGYADGFWRSNASYGGEILVSGKKAPIVGRVCMDQITVDVSSVPDVSQGDTVTVMGKCGSQEISANDIAKLNNTISYEILCSVSKRVPRFYLQNGEIVAIEDDIVKC